MASVKEGSVKLVSQFSSHNGNHLLAVYKGLEATLMDANKIYDDKVTALFSAWEHVTTIFATSSQDSECSIVEWVLRHTLYIILQGEWPDLAAATKTHLSVTLQRCAGLLSRHNAAPKCRMLVNLVNDPWGHPILRRIINGHGGTSDDEVVNLINSELGTVLSVRLEILCETRCQDMALNLAEAVIRCLNMEGSRLRAGSTEDEIHFFIDVYICLLYRKDRIHDLINYIKCWKLKDGLLLIQRYSTKEQNFRIWKSCGKVAKLLARYFLTVAMVNPISESGPFLKDLIAEWSVLHSQKPSFPLTLPNMIRKIVLPAESAIHIYTVCEVLVKQFGDVLKPICIELYIRGLTTDMNELEQQKVKQDKEKVRDAELRLSEGFLRLADLVKHIVGVCRECLLTAFSLNPTRSCLERIKEMAIASGKCQNPAVKTRNSSSVVCDDRNKGCENEFTSCAIQVDTGQIQNVVDNLGENANMRMILTQIDTNVNVGQENSTNKSQPSDWQCRSKTSTAPEAPWQPKSPEFLNESSSANKNCCKQNSFELSTEESNSGNMCYRKNNPEFSKAIVCSKSVDPSRPFCVCKLKPKTPAACSNQDVFECNTSSLLNPNATFHLGDLCPECGGFTGIESGNTHYQIIENVMERKERTLDALISIKGNTVTESLNYDVLSAPNQVLDADALGLTPQLCDDLAVVLSSPRYQMLSWVLDWTELSHLCEKYLENSQDMRHATKELKFLNIDYNQFKDWPSDEDEKDEYYGIEKGYEQWADGSSDSDYDFTHSYKKRRKLTESESDSSVVQKGRRRCRKVHRLLSSESDYDSGQRKGRKLAMRRVTSLSVSDSDTGTQDSKTDSLGSDGFKHSKGHKIDTLRRKDDASSAKLFEQDSLKDITHFRVVMDDDRGDLASDISTGDVISIFTQIDKNDKDVSNTQFSQSYDVPLRDEIMNVTLSPDKKSSDPTVLKSLRMFRPHNAKKAPRSCLSQILKGNRVLNKESQRQDDKAVYSKFAPMLSTLNLNPRIVLKRADANNPDAKNHKQAANDSSVDHLDEIPPDMLCGKNNPKNIAYVVGNKTQFPMPYPMVSDMTNKHKLDIIARAVLDSELLAKSVPGLNSLEMIVPPPLEPTVQVVQFPRNPPASNSNNTNSSETSEQKVEGSNNTTTNSANCLDASSSSNHQEANQVSQSSQSRVEDSTQMYQGLPQSALNASQDQEKQKSNSQMDVKYLTKASEVNEILRSTVEGSVSQVQTISLITPPQVSSSGQGKQKLVTQPEVKYLTTTSEVTEILRSTLVENIQLNQTAGSLQSAADGQVSVKQKSNTRSEVRYLSTANEVSEILKSTPVTAHIQKIGQPPVASQLDVGSSSTVSTETSSRPTFPVVKTVDLNILASFISPTDNSSSGLADGSQAPNNDSHMVQLFYKKMKPIMCTQNSTRSAQAENVTDTQTPNQSLNVTTPNSQSAEEIALAHTLFDENFHKYSLNAGVGTKCRTSLQANSTQVASLPKFQHVFGKTIYNQANASSNVDTGANSQTNSGASCEDDAGPSQTTNSSDNAEQNSQAVSTSSSSTVLSKAVQTTAISSSTPQPNSVSTRMSQSESTTLNVLMSPALQLSTSGSVVALASSSVPRHITSSFKRNSRLTVQSGQSHILYDLHQIPSNLENPTIAQGSLSSTLSNSSHRTQPAKVSQSTTHPPESECASTSAAITASTSTVSVVNKDSVIRNNINSLTATLSHRSASHSARTSLTPEPEICIVNSSSSDEEGTDAATQTLISSVPIAQRIALPVVQKSGNRIAAQTSRVVRPVLHIPGGNLISRNNSAVVTGVSTITSSIRQQQTASSASTSTTTNITLNTRLSSQSVGATNTLITPSSMEPSVSSTTLEQLREFESVLEQVTNTSQMKERSTVQPRTQAETINSQQLLLTQAPTSDSSTEFSSNPVSSVSSFPQQFTSITATPRVGVAYVSQAPSLRTANLSTGKISTPVVVVTSYCQPVASPALSVTSQSSSSPCVTPAPTSTGKTPPKSSKSSKSKSVKSSSSSTASKASPVPKPQQKPQEDEQTAQRIYAILDEYAEQLRNSPDLNNKPAPRRRSNPPTNPNQSSKRKKSGQAKVKLLGQQSSSTAIEMSPGADDPRTMGSEDSSSGIMQLSHIQDSPASSVQNTDDTQSLRTTPSLDVTSESGNVRSVGPEGGDVQDNRPQPRLILADGSGISGRTVIVQDTIQSASDVTVSNNATVVAGKPMMVGSTTLPLYVPGGVRQVFLPGLTASVQGRPMVMSKGSKVIRVHQVTVPGTSNVQGAALVVRQMCVNKPSTGASMSVLGQPTVKQVKLPMGSISSQTLTGVTAQPPVVLPPGSHHLAGPVASVATSTLPHTFSFPDSDIESVNTVLQESAMRTEPLTGIGTEDSSLNTSSVNLIHRGVQSSFHDPNNASVVTCMTGTKITHVSPSNLKLDNVDVLNVSNGCEEMTSNACGEETKSGNNSSVLSIGSSSVSLVSNRQTDATTSLSTFQCLGIGFSRQSLRNSNEFHECISENATKSEIMTLSACSENESGLQDDHLSIANLCKRNESISDNTNSRLESSLRSKQTEVLVGTNKTSRSVLHSVEKLSSAQLPESSYPRQMIQAEVRGFQNSSSNPIGSSALNEKLDQDDSSSVAMLPKEGFSSADSSHMESTPAVSPTIRIVPESESLTSREIQTQHTLQPNFCTQAESRSSSSDKDLNLHVSSGDIHLQRSSATSRSICSHTTADDSNQTKPEVICRVNSQIEFGADVAYPSSAKLSNQLDFVSEMTYRLPTKMSTDNHETPWRYVTVPTVKRVHVRHPMITRRGYVERSSEQLGHSLQLAEVEDSSQERRSYISDAKLEPVGKKSSIATATVLNAYRKMGTTNQRIEKQVSERLESIQQKIPRLDKELKLQKSLSEECEDLGVDEPSTSDLFPEADLLLDTNSSPSFEQTIQDASCNQSVESSEQYSCTNFRPLEYSSSSQEASHLGSPPLDPKLTECSGNKRSRKRACQSKIQHYDWKYRAIGRERTRRMVRSSIIHRGESSKMCSLEHDSSVNGSSKNPSPNLIEDSSNGGSKDDFSESTSGTSVQESSLPESKRVLMEQDHLSDCIQSDCSKKLSEKNLLRKPLICNKELDLELSLGSSSKQILSESSTGSLKSYSVASKVILSSPRTNTFSASSSEDLVTMLDSYATNMILSSLDVTIPSPVPALPATVSQTQDSMSSLDPLPSLTAAQKFSNTYRKRQISGRQDMDRVIKRTRLNRPNQYFNDHVDSQETWESSSSQEKTCADDEDSGSQSRTEEHSSTPDQPNSDIDVVDISNDAFPASTTSFSSVPSLKTGICKSDMLDKSIKSFNLNGIDLKETMLLSSKSDMSKGKEVSNSKRATRKNISVLNTDKSETESGSVIGNPRKNRKTSRSNIRQSSLNSSKSYVPTKQSPMFGTFSESRKLIVRARKVEECGFNLSSVSGFMKSTSTPDGNHDEDRDNSIPSRSQVIDKTSICSVDSQCETQLNPLSVSRRSSLRGHIKKGCTCCSVSPQPSKKKKDILKVEKPSKKGPLKGNISKKR